MFVKRITDKELQEDEPPALASSFDSEVSSKILDKEGTTTVGEQLVAHLDLPESFPISIQNTLHPDLVHISPYQVAFVYVHYSLL